MRLTRLSIRATGIEHAIYCTAIVGGLLWGAVRLPLPVEATLQPDAALIWACLVASASGVCLRAVLPGHDDIPRRPEPMWVAGRVLVVVGAAGCAIGAVLLLAPTGEGSEVRTALARNIAGFVGLVLLTRRLPWGLWAVLPWVWVFAALLLGRNADGGIERWALPMAEPSHGWTAALALLLVGALVHILGEMEHR